MAEIKSDEKMPPTGTALHRAVIAGATGSIGRHVVKLLVQDPRVSCVTALTRGTPKPMDFYGLSNNDKIDKLTHLKVDYSQDLDTQFGDNIFTIGASCIGVYTWDTKNEQDFFDKEYKPNMNVAKAAASKGCTRWSYMSGQGVKQTKKKQWNQMLFSWVKGCVERDLSNMKQFECFSSVRPGFIWGRPKSSWASGVNGWIEKTLNKWPSVPSRGFAVHRDDIAKAMVYDIINDNIKGKIIHENADIKKTARKYDTQLKALIGSNMVESKQENVLINDDVNSDEVNDVNVGSLENETKADNDNGNGNETVASNVAASDDVASNDVASDNIGSDKISSNVDSGNTDENNENKVND